MPGGRLRRVTIIQARTSSARLKAKALLRIAGYPSAILAALRAANQSRETILATSNDSSDDELAQLARDRRLVVFRGPLNDVLGRYRMACSHLPDDCAIIRLTADNPVPDGNFAEELAQAFASTRAEYLSTDPSATGLPYGLGGEVFSVGVLRKAALAATSQADREHAGPWMRRNCRSVIYRPQREDDADYSYLRCTIDDKDDYDCMVRLFDQIADPINVSWQDLLGKLVRAWGEREFRVPFRMIEGRAHSKLALGTAQLGMAYGVVNVSGKPSMERAVSIVRKAVSHGVTDFDTARSYGAAEEVLGKALHGSWGLGTRTITKLSLPELHADATPGQVRQRVDESVRRSCDRLGTASLPVLLLHRWRDHDSWNGAAWQRLLELRDEGKIGILGASVYQPWEALAAMQEPSIGHLQIPVNVLDWRWEADGVDRAIASRPDLVVHARSTLLQGILAHPASRWPSVDGFSVYDCSNALNKLARELGRKSVTDFCLAYVRSLPWVSSMVVGCETMELLEENLRLCQTPDLTQEECDRIRSEVPRAPDTLLNPSKWKIVDEVSVPS
ncbi:MAG: aldo/keto reductase [Candidatus Sulfotelmatobacter sp.]